MKRYAFAAVLLLLSACSRSSNVKAIRLVDAFTTAKIEGAPSKTSVEHPAIWEFAGAGKSKEEFLGWKAGDGVTGLKVVDGKLTGRTTTDFPIIYASRP